MVAGYLGLLWLSPLPAQEPKLRDTLKGHTGDVACVAFSPDGKMLASSGRLDMSVKLWDIATGKEMATLKGHTRDVSGVAFSPDGKLLASASTDKTIKLWDVSTGKEQMTLKGHTDMVRPVAFSPDGSTLASASQDKTIRSCPSPLRQTAKPWPREVRTSRFGCGTWRPGRIPLRSRDTRWWSGA
jgi:WD40 repeat protein